MNTSSAALKHSEPSVTDGSIPPILSLEHGYRPSWLFSDYESNSWVVADTGANPKRRIEFDLALPNDKRLTDYPNLLASIKRVVYGVRIGPLMSVESGHAQQAIASNLIVLVRWMISNEILRFDDLTTQDAREYCELAVHGVSSILNAEAQLNRHIETLICQANFEPTDTPTERRAKAINVVPNYGRRTCPSLNRDEVMKSAGLDGIRSAEVLTKMLDEFAATCEFYLSPAIRNRMASAPSMDELDEQVVTTEHLRRLLMSLDYLYRHRRYLDDAVPYNLFPGSTPGKEAIKLGKAVGRTGTAPVHQAAFLIERAVRWVIDYAPVLLALKEGSSEVPLHPVNAPDNPFPILVGIRSVPHKAQDEILHAVSLREGMTLPTALCYLMAACAVVIAAFTARRAAEILGLKSDCIEPDDSGKPWLRAFIHKTIQGSDAVPVPEIVVAAVSVLKQLSANARSLNASPYLFQYDLPGTDTCFGLNSEGLPVFDLRSYLRKFGYFIDVPPLPDGTLWTFRPHQFRRFFAILYIWIYDLGDWGALSHQLRHFNPERTRRYVTDNELGQILSVVNRKHTAEILANAALGKVRVSGVGGARYKEAAKRLHDRMAQQLQVVSERKYIQRIMRLVERTGVTLRALPWGYCASVPLAAERSCACASTGETGPDYGAATFSTCKDCSYGFRTPAFLPYLKSSLKLHEDVAQSASSPAILRRASETLSRELREYIQSVGDLADGAPA